MSIEDKSCTVAVHNVHGWTLDAEALAKAMGCTSVYIANGAKHIDVYPQERVPMDAPPYKGPGSIEWIFRINYGETQWLTVGMYQREPGGSYSFNS